MPKAALVVLADRRVVPQQLVAAQDELAKIHHALALALVFIELVNLDLTACLFVTRLHRSGAQALLLASANEVLRLLGRKALVVHVVGLHQALDCTELVLRVQNLKPLRQIGQLVVRPQKPVAQAVKGADPHAAHVDRQHGREPRHHLLGSFVGKGHSHHATGRNLATLQQPGNAGGEHPRLARASTRQNKRVLIGQRHGSGLLRVKCL